MRNFILFLGLVVISGCGIGQNISENCGGYMGSLCTAVFGDDSQEIEDLKDQIETDSELTEEGIAALQEQILALQTQLVEINMQDNVIGHIDPCGDHPGHYDEIILRTSQNNLVAYFQSGGQRFLALLPPGEYRTTDKQRCRFTVTEDMEIL